MKRKMLANKGRAGFSDRDSIFKRKILNANHKYNYPKSLRTAFLVNPSISNRIQKYCVCSNLGSSEFLNLAIAAANQEILDEYFEGISQEQFASLFPNLEKTPFHKGRKRLTVAINGATLACARRLAAPLNFSQYTNRAAWRFLEKCS